MRITKDMDWLDWELVEQVCHQAEELPGCSAHASLPCTAWSTWQEMALHKYGDEYAEKLKARRVESLKMLRHFFRLAEINQLRVAKALLGLAAARVDRVHLDTEGVHIRYVKD